MTDDNRRLVDRLDPDILDRALKLIRDCYGSADRSVFFLEINTGVSAINSGIANQRDCFSHLVTLLKNPEFTPEQQLKQIGSMEEHLRRAVLEPPMIALTTLWERFEPILKLYKETVLTLPDLQSHLPGAPSHEVVAERRNAILKLHHKARSGKAENRWDSDWELAVAETVEAFNRLTVLKDELERYNTEASRIRQTQAASKAGRRQFWIGIAAGGVITLLVSGIFYALTV